MTRPNYHYINAVIVVLLPISMELRVTSSMFVDLVSGVGTVEDSVVLVVLLDVTVVVLLTWAVIVVTWQERSYLTV